MKKSNVSLELAGKTLTFETGHLANGATSAVLARLGDTMVLVAVVEGRVKEDLGYFPLSVDYVERLYAGGRIKGSRWVKREGRPTDDAILTARLIDRSIRPLFPKEYKNEVQIIVTVLSVDGENDPNVLAINAVSAALHISHIPWKGPIGAVRVGHVEDKEQATKELVFNPSPAQLEFSEIDLVVSQTKEKTHMLEAGAKQVSEEVTLSAIQKAHEVTNTIISFIENWAKDLKREKNPIVPDAVFEEVKKRVEKSYKQELIDMIPSKATKESSSSSSDDLLNRIYDELKMENPEAPADKKHIAKAMEYVMYKAIKENAIKSGKRPDGRKIDEIRPISGETGVLPRTHGSAVFERGTTQALTVVTLGSPRLEQLIESAEGEEVKRYIHHYSMPAYSVGETGRVGTPSRREIGHGALAERALEAVIPAQEKFPYTIRVVSEILSSNGSTSMASTCGSTLALMDAGVPIIKPVAGVAMGLMSNDENYVILTDILGLEDFSGDMDFKVAGTDTGITAIQLDTKILGLTDKQIEEIFARAKTGRLFILDKMIAVMGESRTAVSEYAPKIEMIKIPVEKIGELIGPGGRTIKNIIATTGATVDVEDDGKVAISGTDAAAVAKASDWVRNLTREVVAGEVFDGEVKRILPFGAFVEILPGKEGMVHVSKMSTEFVKNPEDVVQIGQKVKVRVVEIDEQGRINLSMLFGEEGEAKERQPRPAPMQPRDSRMSAPERSDHPLARQFRRERAGSAPRFGQRKTSSTRFRKTHY